LAGGLSLAQISPKGTFKIESETKSPTLGLEDTDVACFVVLIPDPSGHELLNDHPEENPTTYFISADQK
jgi:hypothetical protein